MFLTPMAADLHTSTTVITGAFTANVLTAAALAVPVGRLLDRHGGRALMTTGSIAGALLLAAWANVDSVTELYAVQIAGHTSVSLPYPDRTHRTDPTTVSAPEPET